MEPAIGLATDQPSDKPPVGKIVYELATAVVAGWPVP